MKNLKYLLLFSIFVIIIIFHIFKSNILVSKLDSNSYNTGLVTNTQKKEFYYKLSVRGKEKFIVRTKEYIEVGSYIKVKGTLINNKLRNFNLFNYENYLMSNKIFYEFDTKEINITGSNKIYLLKDKLYKYIDTFKYSSFIKSSLFNTKDFIDIEENGLNNLYTITFSSVLFIFLKKLYYKFFSEIKLAEYIFIILLFICSFFLNYSFTVIKFTLINILYLLNKRFKLNIKNSDLILICLIIMLIFNINILLNEQYIISFIISYLYRIKFNRKYIVLLLIPVYINANYNINIIEFMIYLFNSFIYLIMFTLSFICLLIPRIEVLILFFQKLIGYIFNKLITINVVFVFKKIPFILILNYYLIIYLILKKKIKIYIYFLYLFFHMILSYFSTSKYVSMIDVGQGDSFLVSYNNTNILIDTGGNLNYDSSDAIKTYLYSKGIRRLDYMIITHGDNDHCLNGINLNNKFKIENILINNGTKTKCESNYKDAIEISEVGIEQKGIKLHLKSYETNNENDSSIIVYIIIDNYKLLFTGDISNDIEKKYIIDYNIKDIDVLKVSHHGSKYSSDEIFLRNIRPKISLIGVGSNNLYGHPNELVVSDLLKYGLVYKTSTDYMVELEFKKNIVIKKGNSKDN